MTQQHKLYEHRTYRAMAESMLDDSSLAPIMADWVEETQPWGLHDAYIAHLRAGAPTPKQLEGYDWGEAFAYAGERGHCNSLDLKATPPGNETPADPFSRRDVRRIIAMQDGDNDGPDWVIVGELWDGRFFSLRAGCDYTGWD